MDLIAKILGNLDLLFADPYFKNLITQTIVNSLSRGPEFYENLISEREKFLQTLNEKDLYWLYNFLENTRYLLPNNPSNNIDYSKLYPKLSNIILYYFRPSFFKKLNYPEVKEILDVAENMPPPFQKYICNALYENPYFAHQLTELTKEFPILKDPEIYSLISLNNITFDHNILKFKENLKMAEIILNEYKDLIDDPREDYKIKKNIYSALSNGDLNLQNYKKFISLIANPLMEGYIVRAIFSDAPKNSSILKPELVAKIPNARKFCQIFNQNFFGAKLMDIQDTINQFIEFLVLSWGKDVNFAPKLADFFSFNKYLHRINNSILIFIIKIIMSKQVSCTNLEHLSGLFRSFILIERKLHNLYGSLEGKDDKLINKIIIAFLNGKYDVNSDLLDKAMDIVLNDSILNTDSLAVKCSELDIDHLDFVKKINELKNQFFHHRLQLNKTEIYDLDNKINLIESYDGIKKYKEYKKDKTPELYNLNYIINDYLKFEVLPNNSFEYFTVGSDTGCCQRLKRDGAAACVDSYINPLAGVLTLKGRIDKTNTVIAQSYFHYVPEDNGYILDNIEANDWAVKRFKINLDSLYASLGAKLKQDGFTYLRCGKGYNKLNNSSFKSSKDKKDKRHFEQESLGLVVEIGNNETTTEKYVDYKNYDFLDLFQPAENITLVELHKLQKLSALSLQFYSMALKLGL